VSKIAEDKQLTCLWHILFGSIVVLMLMCVKLQEVRHFGLVQLGFFMIKCVFFGGFAVFF
jgi:hypothetical protein